MEFCWNRREKKFICSFDEMIHFMCRHLTATALPCLANLTEDWSWQNFSSHPCLGQNRHLIFLNPGLLSRVCMCYSNICISLCGCRLNWGGGIAQWLECRTCDRKVAGLNPCRSGGRIFRSRVNFLGWLLFRHPFHTRVTAVACKRPRSLPKVQVAGYS